MAKIRVLAVDVDGCFMGASFARDKDRNIVTANEDIINKILGKTKYKKTILNLASNRQSIAMDYQNSIQEHVGSAFPQMAILANRLGAEFDPFILADLFNDHPDGHSIRLAQSYYEDDGKTYKPDVLLKDKSLPGWIEDVSKISIVYAQMQRAAINHPDDEISYTFIDDREDIRDSVYQFFAKNKDLIPANVKLKIRGYEGPVKPDGNAVESLIIKNFPSLQGTQRANSVDHDYRNTVKMMTAVVLESEEAQDYHSVSDNSCRPIIDYTGAKNAGFHVVGSVNCAKYYTPGVKPYDTSFQEQPESQSMSSSSTSSKSKSASSSSKSVLKKITNFFSSDSSKNKDEKASRKKGHKKDKDDNVGTKMGNPGK